MAYNAQTDYSSKNFTPAAQVPAVFGMARSIEGITIHHWGAPGQRFEQVRNWLCTNNVPSSAHYVVEAGTVACIVSPNDAAWHAGNPRGNAKTIGIECRPEATDGDYATVAELVVELRQAYGDLRLFRHSDWTSTACPGSWDLARLDSLARAGASPAPQIQPVIAPATVVPPVQNPENEPVQWLVEPGETLSQVAAYYHGPSVAEIAAANGIADPNSIQTGQVLTIPGSLQWVVDPGDTISSIAGYYRLSADHVQRLNNIADANLIYPGQVLTIQ